MSNNGYMTSKRAEQLKQQEEERKVRATQILAERALQQQIIVANGSILSSTVIPQQVNIPGIGPNKPVVQQIVPVDTLPIEELLKELHKRKEVLQKQMAEAVLDMSKYEHHRSAVKIMLGEFNTTKTLGAISLVLNIPLGAVAKLVDSIHGSSYYHILEQYYV